MATYYMYFPFLACEVKCGAAALDVADRQNAHSMTLAARGIVECHRKSGYTEHKSGRTMLRALYVYIYSFLAPPFFILPYFRLL
jgi:hypothetical protein